MDLSNHSNKIHPMNQVTNNDVPLPTNNKRSEFEIIWNDFSYKIKKNTLKSYMLGSPTYKSILCNLSGYLKSGELIAIMGPSGCGKSTLLNSIVNHRKKEFYQKFYFYGERDHVNIVFIPQYDNYLEVLTVEEAMIFASKLQISTKIDSNEYNHKIFRDKINNINLNDMNTNEISDKDDNYNIDASSSIQDKSGDSLKLENNNEYYKKIIYQTLKLLGLENYAKIKIGRLSGGQKKRLSIAQELISQPDVLLLDEPTSGLDSSASYSCTKLLHDLVSNDQPIAIAITIHQPNIKILNLFDKIYVLSKTGQCIYYDSPNQFIQKLNEYDIKVPDHTNPADIIIELASDKHKQTLIDQMALKQNTITTDYFTNNSDRLLQNLRYLYEVSNRPSFPYFKHLYYLTHRSIIITARTPILATSRIILHIILPLLIGYIFGSNVGIYSGCPLNFSFDLKQLNNISDQVVESTKGIIDNFSLLFFKLLTSVYGALTPVLVTFPMEITVFMKEESNNWYSAGPYYLSKIIADIPIFVMCILFSSTIPYILTNQIREWSRYINYVLLLMLTGLVGQSQGVIFGILFVFDITSAIFVGIISTLPFVLFSGFLVKFDSMPALIRPLSNLSYFRYSFEGIIISIYGLDRCDSERITNKLNQAKQMLFSWMNRMFLLATESMNTDDEGNDIRTPEEIMNKTNEISNITSMIVDRVINSLSGGFSKITDKPNKSAVLEIYSLEDKHLYRAYYGLIITFILFRLFGYLILKWRVKHN